MNRRLPRRHAVLACAFALGLLIAGCAEQPRPAGLADVIDRPAEKALLTGMRAYDDAQYADAEASLNTALGAGLASPRDKATAYKLLAFIYCTSDRVAQCEQAFRSARQADPNFALSRSEAGHPLWGPVYRKAVGG
jgi:Tfp pilus assembly protein PilF